MFSQYKCVFILIYCLYQWLCVSLIQFSCSVMSDSLWPHGLQHTRLPCPSPSPLAFSNLCPLSQWCHPTISFSVISFSSRLQSFPASESFLMSRLFASGRQSIGAAHQSFQWIFRTNFLQDWLVGSPCSPRDSQESSLAPQFESISAQPSLRSNSHIRTWLLEKP